MDKTVNMIECSLKAHSQRKKPFNYFKELEEVVGFPLSGTPVKRSNDPNGSFWKFHPYIWKKIARNVKGDLSGGKFWGNKIIKLDRKFSDAEKCARCNRLVFNVWIADIFVGLEQDGVVSPMSPKNRDRCSFPFKYSLQVEDGEDKNEVGDAFQNFEKDKHMKVCFETKEVINEELIEYVKNKDGKLLCVNCKKKIDRLKNCVVM